MDDDIVARLRVLKHHAKKLAENESLHDLHREAFTRCEDLTWKAADEIERLRAVVEGWERSARNADRDIETLRAERDGYLAGNQMTLRALAEENKTARRYKLERDGKISHIAALCSFVAFKMALRKLDAFDTEQTAIESTADCAVKLAREIVRQSEQEPSS